jgi:cell division protein FtsB
MVANFRKKGNREFFNEKLLFQTVGIVFLVIVVILTIADFKIYRKKQELISQIDAYQKQIQDIEKSSKNLKIEIENADNPDYLEKIAYEQLDQQRPGEKEVIFTALPQKVEPAPKPQNTWTAWLANSWQWIKSKF